MWYYKLNLWFASRILFYNCCFSFLSLASAREFKDLYLTIIVLLTAGFIVGSIAQRILHKPEEYVFQNLGISNVQRYGFAYVIHLIFSIPALFIIYLIVNYV